MQPEIRETMTNEEHILADLHDLARALHEFRQLFDAKVGEWEEIARPFARMKSAAKLRGLGRGGGAVP